MEDNFKGRIETSYMTSTPWWPEQKHAPEGAPNILFILLDDTGYSQVGCYGSLVETPNIDALAADGIRYSDFHVNAMCSPTRASLLTGCNNHTVGFGYLSNNDYGFPSLRGEVPHKYCFLSEALQQEGYFTCQVGKWHLINDRHMSGAGPFDQWPQGRGFDKNYTHLHASTSQWYPSVARGNEIVDPPRLNNPGYQFGADIVDNAIQYIGDCKSNDPTKPFFCYMAFGAMHGPHHAPREYIDRYKGKFDMGYDVYRQMVFDKQKEMGLIPQNAVLTPPDYKVQPWDTLTDRQKKVFARYMEVFAGYLTYTDEQIGRVIDYLKQTGEYDNTMIVFLTDNGASAEGGPQGCANEFYHIYTMEWDVLADDETLEKLGGPEADANYPIGWAWAGNAPLKWYKSWVHAGGIKVPCILTYPKVIKDKGGIRSQFHHVIDLYPTMLELAGIQEAEYVNGYKQEAKHGISMCYSFNDANAPRQRHTQYFEMHGNRGIWHDGWKAVANHVDSPTFDDDKWELYHTDEDFSEANNLAEQYPEKLQRLKEMWWEEAGKYDVLPLIESHHRNIGGFNFNKMWIHADFEIRQHYRYYPQMRPHYNKPMFGGKSFTINTVLDYQKGDRGVLAAGGMNCGGFVVFVDQGRLTFYYNFLQHKQIELTSCIEIPEGNHELRLRFDREKPGYGIASLYIDSEKTGECPVDTEPLFPMPGTFAVCRYGSSPICPKHTEEGYFEFTGSVKYIDIDFDEPVTEEDQAREVELQLRNE